MTRTIEHRTNNAYDTILLIENGKVVGNWTIGTYGDEMNNFENPGDLSQWEPAEVESINAEDYGELVSTKMQTIIYR